MNKFMPCVYKISYNKDPNVCYIGSTISFKSRMSYHQCQCKYNSHYLLYSSINLNGGCKNWTFEVLKNFYGISKEQLRIEEDKFIKLFNPPLNSNKAHLSKEEKRKQAIENCRKYRQKKPNYAKEYYIKKKEQKALIEINIYE